MSYTPDLKDAAVDLYRVVNCSLTEKGWEDENARVFLENALVIIEKNIGSVDALLASEIMSSLKKGLDETLSLPNLQEQLLLLASLLR